MPLLPQFANQAGIQDPTTEGYLDGALGAIPARDTIAGLQVSMAQRSLREAWAKSWARGQKLSADPTRNEAAREIASAKFAKAMRAKAMKQSGEAESAAIKAFATVTGTLKAAVAPPQDAGRGALHSEIRAHLKGLSIEDRNEMLSGGDQETVKAVISAPGYLSGIVPATHSRISEEYLAQVEPQALAQAKELEEALRSLEHTRKAAGEHFGDAFDFQLLDSFEDSGGEAA